MTRIPPDPGLWILAGQSNMQGAGPLTDPSRPPIAPPDDRVWTLTTAGDWRRAEEPLHRLWESFTPVHRALRRPGEPEPGPTEVIGAGLGLAFGIARADATGRAVGLIPCAHGGTTLEQWSPEGRSVGGSSLYGAMLERVRRAIKLSGGTVHGILWYQGEDERTPELAASYARRLSDWIAAARADLGIPDLPFYAVQISRLLFSPQHMTGWSAEAWQTVRDQIRQLPDSVPHTGITSAIDLALSDAGHLDAPSLIRLGRRLARLAATGGTGPRVASVERGTDALNGLPTLRVRCEGVTGGWQRSSAIPGFAVRDPEGRPHAEIVVIDASVDAREPTSLRVTLSGMDDTVRIGYGLGFDPVCVLVDEADMPLPAFTPVPLSTS